MDESNFEHPHDYNPRQQPRSRSGSPQRRPIHEDARLREHVSSERVSGERSSRPYERASHERPSQPYERASHERPPRSEQYPDQSRANRTRERVSYGRPEQPYAARASRTQRDEQRRTTRQGSDSRQRGDVRATPSPTRRSSLGESPAGRDRPGYPGRRAPRTPSRNQQLFASGGRSQNRRRRLVVIAIIVVAAFVIFALTQCAGRDGLKADAQAGSQEQQEQVAQGSQNGQVSFVACGDNLVDDGLAEYADAWSGETGDGIYDWRPLYEKIKPYVAAADLAYVKQETHCGGDDIGPKGYPSFNTTDSMADAIVDTGFDLVASASNHSYDWGYYGANDHSSSVWLSKPVQFTGTAASQEQADKLALTEVNGITFALLDYTYGVNGYSQSDLEPYEVNFIEQDRIAADVARARQSADVVLVAMHWGTENQTEPDEMQLEYAQFLADQGVDVVLGSHPHVIGQLQWVQGSGGNRTLVAYSLGNFVSNHQTPDPLNELEGMLTCDFVKKDGEVSIENVTWVPLVNHTDGTNSRVYAVKDYTNELAANHPFLKDLNDPVAWLKQTTADVVGSEFTIDA